MTGRALPAGPGTGESILMAQLSDREYLDMAARAALRGRGRVEPNPCVGAVVVSADGAVAGIGHHARFGEEHAEVAALRACRERGRDPRGGTMYVTLEPCRHVGKQPACTRAILEAGVCRVVVARRDPNPVSSGGAEVLRGEGVRVDFSGASRLAVRVSDAFITGLTRARPYVIAKWAQSLDGCVATRAGESRWVSGEESRRRVHALRGRVDAVMVGIGTVLADDPMLTARGVPVRRQAARVVIDSTLRTPVESRLVRTARAVPTIVACSELYARASAEEYARRRAALEALGVTVLDPRALEPRPAVAGAAQADTPRAWEAVGRYACMTARGGPGVEHGAGTPATDMLVSLHRTLGALYARGMSNVLIEPGPTMLGSLLAHDLADELRVYIAPIALGEGLRAVGGFAAQRLADARRYEVARLARRGADMELTFVRARGYLEPAEP